MLKETTTNKNDPSKKYKKGIIFLSYIPPGMNVKMIKEYFEEFGEVNNIYFELDKTITKKGKKPRKSYLEGWVEFKKKKVAKQVAELLNGKPVGGKKRNVFYDSIWNK